MEIHSFFLNIVEHSFFDKESLRITFFLLYIGPETILPLTSFVAAVVGILLMFWRWVVGIFRKSLRWCSRTTARILGREWHDTDVAEAPSDIEGKERE